jgi:enterochelin esterase-like enzyme
MLVLAALTFAAPAYASNLDSLTALLAETRQTPLRGPNADETRTIYFWRPPNAEGPLPVLYMADGISGLKVAGAELRDDIVAGRARPLLIVAMDASQPPRRAKEYILGAERNAEWEAHFAWFVSVVIPFAEQRLGASRQASERGVGGFSNGADFAIAAATRRPDLFSAVLAHSPVNEVAQDFRANPNIRWTLTVGSREYAGAAVAFNERIAAAIARDAPVRRCVGAWDHEPEGWEEVSAGSIAWLFNLADTGAVDTPTERAACALYDA